MSSMTSSYTIRPQRRRSHCIAWFSYVLPSASRAVRRMRLRHDECGHRATPRVTCDRCGGELHLGNVTVLPGPGGRDAPGTTVVAERLLRRGAEARDTG